MLLLTVAVLALLIAGVVVTALPKIPGGILLSMAGVYLHWWASGYSAPSTGVLVVLTLLGLLVLTSKVVGPVIVSKIGGASAVTTTIGGVVGGIMFFFSGTVGLVLGTLVTVFILEYVRRGDIVESLIAAVLVILATFAQRAMKTLVTVVILLVMVAVILL